MASLQAELWMGAHPNGCSEVNFAGSTQKLSAFIDAAPAAVLVKPPQPASVACHICSRYCALRRRFHPGTSE